MRALVICDDFYHSGDIVEQGLSFLRDEYDLCFARDMKDFIFSDDYDVILLCKDNQTSPTNKEAWFDDEMGRRFTNYVENGGGLVVMHAGTVACKKAPILKALVGCEFIRHPEQCVVAYHPVSECHIVEDVDAFSEKDEHYIIEISANDINTFLEGTSEHGTVIAGYTRKQGKGRVCVLTPGHNLSVWLNDEYKKIIRNAAGWCSNEDFFCANPV